MKLLMKKTLAALAACLLLSLCALPALAEDSAPLRIVCTTFPQYDWLREILGERLNSVSLTLLLDNGVDLHSYQPTAADIARIADSDLFVYVGGESDAWVSDVLQAAAHPNLTAISLLSCVEAKEEERVEGMQADAHDADEDAHDADEIEYDEHVWLSLRHAQTLTQTLADALSALDTDHADTYQANAAAYIAQLAELDDAYVRAVAASQTHTLLFADRFPFRYLADDYGLTYYAAFVGCSAETEASFETIAFLAGKVNALHLPAILVIEGAQHAIAQTVAANTQQKDLPIRVMNSIQSVTAAQLAQGVHYIDLMRENLEVLKAALQ